MVVGVKPPRLASVGVIRLAAMVGEIGHERFEAVGRKIFAGLFGSSLFRVGKPVNS